MTDLTVHPGTPRQEGEPAYANIHPYVLVPRPAHIDWDDDDELEIDELMVPLIEALWDAGVDTVTCCQGDGEKSFIEFGHPNDILHFLDAVSCGPRDEVYERLSRSCSLSLMDAARFTEDNRDQLGEDGWLSDWQLYPSVSYSVCTADIPELARRFRHFAVL